MDSNLFWCIVGIAGGAVFSFTISYFFYSKGLTKRRLIYEIKTFCIISNKINKIEGLEVTYNSNEIYNLFSSTITIKNIGNSIINKEDIAPLRPISLSTNGKFLIDKSNKMKLNHLNDANNIYLIFKTNDDLTCNNIIIDFDYIAKKEKLQCTLLHTDEISFDGKIKDGKILTPNNMKKERLYGKFLSFFMLLITLTLSNFTMLVNGTILKFV